MLQDFQRDSFLHIEPEDRDFRCPVCFGFVFGLPRECGTCTAFYCGDHHIAVCGVCRQPLRTANAKTLSIIKNTQSKCARCKATLNNYGDATDHHLSCTWNQKEGKHELSLELLQTKIALSETKGQLEHCTKAMQVMENRLLQSQLEARELQVENERLRSGRAGNFTWSETPSPTEYFTDLEGLKPTLLGRLALPVALTNGKIKTACGSNVVLIETNLPYAIKLQIDTGEVTTLPLNRDTATQRLVAWIVNGEPVVGTVNETKSTSTQLVSYSFGAKLWSSQDQIEQCDENGCTKIDATASVNHIITKRYDGWTAIAKRASVDVRSGLARWNITGSAVHLAEDGIYIMQVNHIEDHFIFARYKLVVSARNDQYRPLARLDFSPSE